MPANLPVRPTTDLAKESLFNILENRIDFQDISALDLFAGTGNISYELFSRGAKVTAVDTDFRCTRFILDTIKKLDIDRITVVKADVFRFLHMHRLSYDLIFADPPFDSKYYNELVETILNKKMLNPDGWLVVEHPKSNDFSAYPGFVELRRYGKVHFSFFQQH